MMQIDALKLSLKSYDIEYWSSRTNFLVCITVSPPMLKAAEFFWNTLMYVLSFVDFTIILPSPFPHARKTRDNCIKWSAQTAFEH